MEWTTVNTLDGGTIVVDENSKPRRYWEERLNHNRNELTFCENVYEMAYKEDYHIRHDLQARIDILRAAIYWAEYKLAKD